MSDQSPKEIPNDYLEFAAANQPPVDQARQNRVNALLNKGVVFSILWLMGVGSLIAVINALRARAMIRAANGQLRGEGKVWWCLIVGGLGLVFWVYVLAMVVLNRVFS